MAALHLSLEELQQRARSLTASGSRRVLGIVGPPGGGKSTLAEAIVAHLGPDARQVPMDGFHLANAELERLGRRDRKGAPDTFDGAGYVAMLRRLRDGGEDVVYAPRFDREWDESIAGAIAVAADVPLVVTEGNYLLLDDGPWASVRDLLDEVWYVDIPEETRLRLLIERHVSFGMAPDAARAWALTTDQRNAELVAATRPRATLVVRLHSPASTAASDAVTVDPPG